MTDELKEKINKVYGWKSKAIEQEIDRLVESVRVNEYNRCVRITLQLLIDHINLPVKELYERVKRNEYGTGNAVKE